MDVEQRESFAGQVAAEGAGENDAAVVTLLWAPPGFGKTHWMQQEQMRCAALGQPVAYYDLERINSEFPALAGRLQQGLAELDLQLDFGPAMLPVDLAEAITERLREHPVVLMFDGLDAVGDAATRGFVRMLSLSLPAPSRLVLSCWRHPGLDLSQLELLGRSRILGPKQLCLSDEAVAEVLGDGVNDAEISAVAQVTHGWPGAVQLVQRGLDAGPPLASWVDGVPPRVGRYFAERILDRLDVDSASVLLALSLTDAFDGDLIDQLTGSDRGWSMVGEFCDLGLASPSDPAERLYAIQQPFGNLLRQMFARQPAAFRRQSCRTMALWFADRSAHDTALALANVVGDQALLSELLERAGSWRLAIDGNADLLAEYLPKLLQDTFSRSVRIRFADILLVARTQDAAFARMKFRELTAHTELDEALRVEAQIVDALVAMHEDVPGSTGLIDRLQHLLADLPGSATALHADVSYILFFFYYEAGELQNAVKAAQAAQRIFHSARMLRARLYLEVNLGAALQALGRLNQARGIWEGVVRESREHFGPENLYEMLASLHLSSVLYQQNELSRASALLGKSLRRLEQSECWCTPLILGYRIAANLARAGSGHGGVLEVFRRADQIADKRNLPRLKQVVSILRVIESVKSGKKLQAMEIAHELQLEELVRTASMHEAHAFDFQVVVNFARVALARLWIVSGRAEDAIDMLNRTLVRVRSNGADNYRIRALALRALAEATLGQSQKATATLLDAIAIGQNEGYIRVFTDLGPMIERLVGVCLRQLPKTQRYRTKYQYIFRLQEAFRDSNPSISLLAGSVEFSKRETEVLDLLSAGMTNAEMAQVLGVTVDTVKFHLKKIYRKLGVARRQDVIPALERNFN